MASPIQEGSRIHYGNDQIEFDISRLTRLDKKILIHVEPTGQVIVEAPIDSEHSTINIAVQKRARWIMRQKVCLDSYKAYALPRSYTSGETHFYLGRRYLLKVIPFQEEASVKLSRGKLIVSLEEPVEEAIKRLLLKWYRAHAKQYFQKRMSDIIDQISWIDELPAIRVLTMQKQWGSCSPNGTIILNPSLIKAPRECVDYVLIHELCHLKEHNHSPQFYKLLSLYIPDWRAHKSKLDAIAEMLLVDNK